MSDQTSIYTFIFVFDVKIGQCTSTILLPKGHFYKEMNILTIEKKDKENVLLTD